MGTNRPEKTTEAQTDLFAAVFESSPNILVLVDAEGRVEKINRVGSDFAGSPQENLVGLLAGEVFQCINSFGGKGCGRNAECGNCPVRTRMTRSLKKGEKIFNEEGRLTVRKDAVEVPVDFLISTAPVKVADETKVLVTIVDITEHKRAEEILRESEERYRQAVENSPNPIFSIDREGNIQTWNRACEKTFHYDQSFLGQHYYTLLRNAEERSLVQGMLDNIHYGQSLSNIEMVYRCQDGEERFMVSRIYPFCDQQKEVQGYVFANTDVTERRQAEQALRKSEEQYRLLFNEMLSGFALHEIICDQDGRPVDYRFLAVNAAFEQLTGLIPNEVIGKTVLEVLPGTESFWIERYGKVAIEGIADQFDGYSAAIGKHYEARAFCPEPGKFAVMFHDVTERKKAEEEVRKSKQALEEAERLVHLGHYEIETASGKARWSEEIFNIFGLDPDFGEPTVETYNELIHPDDQAKVYKLYEESVKNGAPFDLVYRIIRTDGDVRYVHSNAKVVIDETENSRKLFGTFQDVTKLKQVELALQESEKLYHDLVETAQDLIWQCDRDGCYIYLNPAWKTVFGYELDEMLGRPFSDFQPPEYAKRDMKTFLHLLKGNSVARYETVHLAKDARELQLVFNAKAVHDAQGTIIGTRGTAYDITERKRVEEALRESEERMRRLASAAHEGIVFTEEGIVVEANEQIAQMLACDLSDLIGFSAMEFVASESRSLVLEKIKSGSEELYEHQAMRKDGTTFPVEVQARMLKVQGRQVRVTAIRDITDRKQAEIALKESAERYRAVVEDQTEFIVRWKPDGTRTFVNEAYLRYYNIPMEEALTSNFMSLIVEEDRSAVEEKTLRLMAGESHSETDIHRVIRPDGSLGWQEWVDHALYDEYGNVVEFQSVGRDITEQKQAELAREESERRFREVLENVQLVAISTDIEGKITFCNDFLLDLVGWTRGELIGKDWFETCLPSDVGPLIKEIFSKALEQENVPSYYENEIQTKLGERRLVVWNNTMLRNIEGQVIGTSSIGEDITERKKAEQALRDREAKLQSIFLAAPVGIGMVIDRVIQEANEMLCQITGYDREELIGQDSRILYLSDREYEYVGTEKYRLLKEHELGTVETKWKHKDGSIRDILLSSVPLDPGDFSKGVTFTALDITDRKQTEVALGARTGELEALFSLSSHLRTAQSAEAMLPLVLDEMRRVSRSDSNAVILLSADETYFVYGLSDGALVANTGKRFEVDKSISGIVYHSRKPYVTDDLSGDLNKSSLVEGTENLGPTVVVPVISESEFLGVLACARDRGFRSQPYSSSEVQLLVAIGEMVGNAMRRARLYDQALTRLQHVQALHSIDMAISANLELSVVLDVLLSQGTAQMNMDAASILLLNPHTHMLEYAAGYGFRTKEIESTFLRLGEGLPGKATIHREIFSVPDISKSENLIRRHLLDEDFVSYHAAPLVAKGQIQGVLEIFNRNPFLVGEEQISFLETLATQAAIAIDNSQLFTNLQRSNFELEMAYDATIEGWSRALELRDQETEGHTLRVTDMTLHLAQGIGVRSKELIHIRRGALLHDIGKMGVPDRILLKPGELVGEEWEVMKQHTVYAFEMLWPIEFLRPAIDIPHCHHERWDGTGYPRHLKEEQIPLSARIFAVADVWDALTSDRPYRDAWTEQKALEYITTNAGKHFDPQVVDVFLELRDENGQK